MFCAFCSKEATIFLPLVAVSYELIVRGDRAPRAGRLLSRLWLHLLVSFAYVTLSVARRRTSVLPSDPYYVSLQPAELIRGGLVYTRWAIKAFSPVEHTGFGRHLTTVASGMLLHRHFLLSRLGVAILWAIAFVGLVSLTRIGKRSVTNRTLRVLSFLVI